MCDYSLQSVKTRDAALHDELIVSNFGTGTRGFACVDDPNCAVCVKPGTEIAFAEPIKSYCRGFYDYITKLASVETQTPTTAIFRQINLDQPYVHHDTLEFADGQQVQLSMLHEGQRARILQMPAAPKNQEEAKAQERLAVTG